MSLLLTRAGGPDTAPGGAAPFDPATYGTVIGWWYFGENTYVLNSSDAAASDGDGIKTVTDRSASAWNASQATAGNRPVWKANIQNGLGIGRFTAASSHFLNIPGGRSMAQNTGEIEVVGVLKPTAGSNVGMFCCEVNTTAGKERLAAYLDTASLTWSVGATRLDADSTSYRSGSNATSGNWYAASWQADYTNGKSRVHANGSDVVSYAAGPTSGTSSNTASGTDPQIGSLDAGSTYYFNGDIGEVILYRPISDRSGLITALRAAARWNF